MQQNIVDFTFSNTIWQPLLSFYFGNDFNSRAQSLSLKAFAISKTPHTQTVHWLQSDENGGQGEYVKMITFMKQFLAKLVALDPNHVSH